MYTTEEIKKTIEAAASIVGSQRKLAAVLDLEPANLIKIKNGQRPCNWRIKGKLRVILGEEPAHAFMSAMAEELADSEREDEKKAANTLKQMLAAFPEEDWRKRRDSNPR